MERPLRPSALHRHAAVAIALAVAPLAGCRTYEAKPIDLAAMHREFLDRIPEAIEVAASAGGLDGQAHRSPVDASDGLSLAEAEAVALLLNADLRLARSAAGVSEAQAAHAGLWPDPVLGLEWTRLLESALNPNELFGSVALTIPISGRLEAEKRRLGAAHAAELARVAAMEWEVRIRLRREWGEWAAAAGLRGSAAEFLAQAESLLEVVDAMERLGELSRVEARLLRLERLQASAQLDRFAAAEEQSRLAILRTLGLPPQASIELLPEGPASAMGLASLDPGDLDRLRASPRLAVAMAAYEVAERALEQEIRAQLPDLGLVPGYGTQDGLRQFTLGVFLPIPIFSGNRQAIESALAARESARREVERMLEGLLADAASAEADLRSRARQRAIVERELVPLVEVQYAEARELARLGEVDMLILLDSLGRLHEARVRLIEARRDERLAGLALEAIAGPPLRGPLPDPEPLPATATEP